MKVGIAKSTSGPFLTMETGLELTEWPLLGGKKTFQIVEKGSGRMERILRQGRER